MKHRLPTYFYVLLVCGCCCAGIPQTAALSTISAPETKLSNRRWLVGFNTLTLYDGYLANVPYEGAGVCFNITELDPPTSMERPWMLYQQMEGSMAFTGNASSTSSITRFLLQHRIGSLYAFKPWNGLKVAAGPLFGSGFGMKQLPRNVNNPYNMDLWVDVLLGATLTYDLPVGWQPWRMKVDLKTPLVGCFFAPKRGQLYYEWWTYNPSGEVFHLSSLHNKNALNLLYTLDIPLRSFVLSVGVTGQWATWETADMVFQDRGWGVMAGISIDVAVLSGFPLRLNPGMVRVDR